MNGTLLRVGQNTLDSYRQNSDMLETLILSESFSSKENVLEMYNDFGDIQYILTEPHPTSDINTEVLSKALISYQMVDETQDFGYGPAFYLNSNQVTETSNELNKVDLEKIKSYPDSIFPYGSDDPERVEVVLERFEDLIEFFKTAVLQDQATIFYMT